VAGYDESLDLVLHSQEFNTETGKILRIVGEENGNDGNE